MRRDETLSAVAISVCWGCIVAVGAYAIVRFIQFFLYPDPNPATLVWSAHAGFFWRCWTCAYAGGLAAFVAFLFTRQGIERSAAGLAPAIAIVAALMAVQVAVFP
ncbi:MAG: hypothetical protein ABSE49_19885 [Polyangiaceae bacterium]